MKRASSAGRILTNAWLCAAMLATCQTQADAEDAPKSDPPVKAPATEPVSSKGSAPAAGSAASVKEPGEKPSGGATWKTYVADGESALSQDHISDAGKQLRAALVEAEKEKAAEKDPTMQKLLMDDFPDLIERVCLDKNYEKAEELAMAKLGFIEKTYGANSQYVLDALQDLQLIYSEQKKVDMLPKVLMRYSDVTHTLQDKGAGADADNMVALRRARLQRQLKERFERIQRRFEPVNK